MQAPEVISVEDPEERLSCDGGGGALGHPTVYFSLGDDHQADCYYCGRRYVLKGSEAETRARTDA